MNEQPHKEASHLIIGASSTIGQAVIDQLLDAEKQVVVISRMSVSITHKNLTWIICDQTEVSIAEVGVFMALPVEYL